MEAAKSAVLGISVISFVMTRTSLDVAQTPTQHTVPQNSSFTYNSLVIWGSRVGQHQGTHIFDPGYDGELRERGTMEQPGGPEEPILSVKVAKHGGEINIYYYNKEESVRKKGE